MSLVKNTKSGSCDQTSGSKLCSKVKYSQVRGPSDEATLNACCDCSRAQRPRRPTLGWGAQRGKKAVTVVVVVVVVVVAVVVVVVVVIVVVVVVAAVAVVVVVVVVAIVISEVHKGHMTTGRSVET